MKTDNLRMPFEVERIRRRPGQSAGEHWRDILDRADEAVMPVLASAVVFLMISISQALGLAMPIWLGVAMAVIAGLWIVYRVLKMRREVRTWRLGENGELYVGQTLEKDMRPLGYDVFHDVVIKKAGRTFNIDHVLIGPNGVYIVETKTWRKPEKGRAEVAYRNGCFYKMNEKFNDSVIREMAGLAKEANRLFLNLTGRSYYVKPILVVAGWYSIFDGAKDAPFWLLNEKQVANWVSKDKPQRVPDPKDLALLRFKLEQYDPS